MIGYNKIEAQIYYPRYFDSNVAGVTGTNYCTGYMVYIYIYIYIYME